MTADSNQDPWAFTGWVKKRAASILESISRFLLRIGIHPNLLTLAGFLFAVISGVFVALGHLQEGAFFLIVSGLFDALDGTLARTAGLESRFGAFLDSFLDRYAESALFFGLLYRASVQGRHDLVLLVFLAMVGSIMVSYARARAEGLGISCKVGLFTRMERFIVLSIALLLEQLFIGLFILALMTNLTALQRMIHVLRSARNKQ
ncbi:MAG: CDP-alcohol phosphatidyltransferase family protein [Pseudomonadota bacterium]